MPRYDFKSPRLFVETRLGEGQVHMLDRAQANYLLNVLRLSKGDIVLLFNGVDGEWRADIEPLGRKQAHLIVQSQTRPQTPPGPIHLLFAPLKQARLEYLVQKAVEMGAGRITPVLTQYTQMRKLNQTRMRAYCIEAAEQCGILCLPHLDECLALEQAVDGLTSTSHIVFCDEGEASQNPLDGLTALKDTLSPEAQIAILIGPEGGFSETERNFLREKSHVTAIPLGPRVLRADTAAVASLAVVQSVLGDWK